VQNRHTQAPLSDLGFWTTHASSHHYFGSIGSGVLLLLVAYARRETRLPKLRVFHSFATGPDSKRYPQTCIQNPEIRPACIASSFLPGALRNSRCARNLSCDLSGILPSSMHALSLLQFLFPAGRARKTCLENSSHSLTPPFYIVLGKRSLCINPF
jgi:hypothetical protein